MPPQHYWIKQLSCRYSFLLVGKAMEKQLYMSGVPQSTIDKWRAEVEALPPRKRSKWSKSCRDDYGVYRLTRYYNGHFQVKVRPCTGKGEVRLPESGWAPVIAHDRIIHRIQLLDSYGEDVVAKVEAKCGHSIGDDPVRQCNYHPRYQGVVEAASRGGVDASNDAIRRMMAENHTGNHYRNKTIAVPTSPGQPVRA